MKLTDILTADCIKSPLEATSKQAAINELVDLLAARGRVRQPAELKDAVWTREMTRTTGIGLGLAIPHGKSAGVDKLAIAIGKPAAPMEFQSIDAKPVKLIILLASPPDKTSDHIQALAHISRLMNLEEFRHQVYSATTGQQIFDLLRLQEQG
ncbi:MAG TPA: PTS sugar transporter subunit IIA [Phycisphaerales bacterium]|nr:PTS sugar transporter subunit IIA [Phycisphaerales bacterium]